MGVVRCFNRRFLGCTIEGNHAQVAIQCVDGRGHGIVKQSFRRICGNLKTLGWKPPERLGAVALIACLALTACESEDSSTTPGQIGIVVGFAGGVAADEPRAAVVGREVLAAGGNAADAAVAMGFTMSVTLPSRASLGSGGACVVFDPARERVQAVLFPTERARSGAAIPGLPRGMAALHATFGGVRWAQVLVAAEQYARFGHGISRSFLRDVSVRGQDIYRDPEARRVLFGDRRQLPEEGQEFVQPELSTVLSGLRQQGAGYFYTGPFARRFAEAAIAAGQPIEPEEMRDYRARLEDTVSVQVGNELAHVPPPPGAAGLVAAEILGMIGGEGPEDFADAATEERLHLFVEAAKRAFADRGSWLGPGGEARIPAEQIVDLERLEQLMADYAPDRATPVGDLPSQPAPVGEDPNSAGLVAVDRAGMAVACSFSMNQLMGTAQMAPGTGIMLAAPPRPQGGGEISLTPLLLVNPNFNDIFFAGTATAGPAAPTVLTQVMLRTLQLEDNLETAMLAPRVHHMGSPDVVWHEPDLPQDRLQALSERGHDLREVPKFGRINAVVCPRGVRRRPELCQAASDPRGFGLAERVE
jgi:gamma-glutamyltranspeptidase/glutathione hydrolase